MNFYDNAKGWWRSLTIWWGNALIVIGAIIEYVNSTSGLLSPYFGKWGGVVTLGIGVLNVLLRLRTAKPISGTVAAKKSEGAG